MTQTRTLIRKLLLPFGVVGLVVTAGMISNLVTAAVYRKNLIAGTHDSGITVDYHAFDDLGSIPDSFVGSRMDVAVAIPFYVQVCVTFNDGPDRGDQFRHGLLTCFGTHIQLWEAY